MLYPPTMQQQQQQQQINGNQNQQNAIKPPMMNHHHHAQMQNPLANHQTNHLNPATMLNQSMNNNNTMAAHQAQHGLPIQSGHPQMYDHMLQNAMNGNMQKGPSGPEFIYSQHPHQHPHHLNMAQNQYMRNNVSHPNAVAQCLRLGNCLSLAIWFYSSRNA